MKEADQPLLGPHEGQELSLMLAGSKHLSVFCIECQDHDWSEFPESDFDEEVAKGNFIKRERRETVETPQGDQIEIRTVLYATSQEFWRISGVYLFVDNLYRSLGAGYRPDFERVIGGLLGYASNEIEFFIDHLQAKGMKPAS